MFRTIFKIRINGKTSDQIGYYGYSTFGVIIFQTMIFQIFCTIVKI